MLAPYNRVNVYDPRYKTHIGVSFDVHTHQKHCNRDLSPPCRGLRYRGVGKRSFACSPNRREEFFSETGLPLETVRKVRIGLKVRLCESAKRGKALLAGRSRPPNLPLILRSNYFSDSF